MYNYNYYISYNLLIVGDARRHSDGGVLANSDFGQALDEGALMLPDDRALPGKNFKDCYIFTGSTHYLNEFFFWYNRNNSPSCYSQRCSFSIKKEHDAAFPREKFKRTKSCLQLQTEPARCTIEKSFGILAAR